MNKKWFVVVGLGVLMISIIFLFMSQSFTKEKKKEMLKRKPTPRATFPFPTPSPLKETLRIVSIVPNEDVSKKYLPITQIEFIFDSAVDPKQFFYEVSPRVSTSVRLKQGTNNALILSPETAWKTGITTITVLQKTTSLTGATLEKPFTYRISTDFPENPPPDEDAP